MGVAGLSASGTSAALGQARLGDWCVAVVLPPVRSVVGFQPFGALPGSSVSDTGNLAQALLALSGKRTLESEVELLISQELEVRARQRAELRELLVLCGSEPPSGIALQAVLSECPDVDLAFTALTMVPRPRWVEDLAGPVRA
jgi:hypothetical protein